MPLAASVDLFPLRPPMSNSLRTKSCCESQTVTRCAGDRPRRAAADATTVRSALCRTAEHAVRSTRGCGCLLHVQHVSARGAADRRQRRGVPRTPVGLSSRAERPRP